MFRPRVIPVILIGPNGHASKSVRFKRPLDLGDPVNMVSLFNAFQVDELVILDTLATREGRSFPDQLMIDLASEARIPLSVGGGVRTLDDIRRLLTAGAEKVVLSSAAIANPAFVDAASREFGSSSITVCMDIGRNWRGRERIVSRDRQGGIATSPVELARVMEQAGAGEIIVQSVDRDGTMGGYDLALVSRIADAVGAPVIALGGAGRFEHLIEASRSTNASAFASGSLFSFQDENRGVLVSYPSPDVLRALARD